MLINSIATNLKLAHYCGYAVSSEVNLTNDDIITLWFIFKLKYQEN